MSSYRGPPPPPLSSSSNSRRRVSIDSIRSQHASTSTTNRHDLSARSPVSPSPVTKSTTSHRQSFAASSSRRASQRFAEAMNSSRRDTLGLDLQVDAAQQSDSDDDRTPGINRAPFAYFSSANSSRRPSSTQQPPAGHSSDEQRSVSGLRPAIPFLRSLSSQSDLDHRQSPHRTTIAARRGSGVADLSLRPDHAHESSLSSASSYAAKTAPNYATFASAPSSSTKRHGRLYDTLNTGILRSPRNRPHTSRPRHHHRNEEDEHRASDDERTDLLDTFRRTEFPLSRGTSRSTKSPGQAASSSSFIRSVRKTASAVGLGTADVASYDDLPGMGTVDVEDEEAEDDMEKTDAAALNGVRVWYR